MRHQLLIYTSDGKVHEIFVESEDEALKHVKNSTTGGVTAKDKDGATIFFSPHNIVKIRYAKI